MIEKMKKLTFLVTESEYESFLADLRGQGVVHVQQLQEGTLDDSLSQSMAQADRYKAALAALDYAGSDYADGTTYAPESPSVQRGEELLTLVEANLEEHNRLMHSIDQVEKNLARLEPWGDFDTASLQRMRDVGYGVNFYTCPAKLLRKEWVDEYFATVISEVGGKAYFITFSAGVPDISAERLELPEKRQSEYLRQLGELRAQLKENQAALYRYYATARDSLLMAKIENENTVSLSQVRLSGERVAQGSLRLMVGWVLADKADALAQHLDENHIFYELEEPSFDDDVPVKITNDRYSRLFEPILRMYSLPTYHDLDPTPFFAPFFMLFFGLCMGDAGYGLLILVAALIGRGKLADDMRPYATLGVFLGAMTIVCGLLTGSFFGIDLTQQDWAFLAPVKGYFINEKNFTLFGYSPMMVISVFIGLTQVLIGMVLSSVKAATLYGWRFGIGKMSWVVALLAGIACFGLPACGVQLPLGVTYVLYGVLGLCGLGIYFYNSPDKNIFMNVGSGIWGTYNMATGLLGDLLSYIRLFALGLTGGVLGGVFNELATTMTDGMPAWVRWLPMLVILLLGHGINFALCMISSFVHPMRLTFVEFFKNADFDGGGKEYSPFRVKSFRK